MKVRFSEIKTDSERKWRRRHVEVSELPETKTGSGMGVDLVRLMNSGSISPLTSTRDDSR